MILPPKNNQNAILYGYSRSKFSKKYDTQRAVDGISFDVKSGEILGFLGPNGARKTTTMKILTCYMLPTEGDVLIGDYSVRQHLEQIKKRPFATKAKGIFFASNQNLPQIAHKKAF